MTKDTIFVGTAGCTGVSFSRRKTKATSTSAEFLLVLRHAVLRATAISRSQICARLDLIAAERQ
jgi:hypothetical protein